MGDIILKLDFVYDKITKIIKKYNWDNVKEFDGINDLEKYVKPCYLFMDLLSEESLKYLSDASKIFIYCQAKDYNPGYFSSRLSSFLYPLSTAAKHSLISPSSSITTSPFILQHLNPEKVI